MVSVSWIVNIGGNVIFVNLLACFVAMPTECKGKYENLLVIKVMFAKHNVFRYNLRLIERKHWKGN